MPPPPDNETPPQLPTGVTLDDFVAYMPAHTYIFKPSREPWPGASVNARIAPVANGAGKPLAASAWLDKNAPVEQMTWAPGKPAIIRNQLVLDGGFVRRDGASVFNLYKPPIAEPGDAAKAGLWLDHVYRVFPGDGGDHFLKWCAYRVQHPEIKINHALILGGEQGVGKDTAMEPAKHAVGHWNFAEVKPKQIMQRFNPCLRSVILRVSEGRDLGEVDRYQFYDHLKDYIASPPDVLRVDEKNLREHMVINCTGFVITTNHKTGGLYLPPDDRRHYVMWCGLRRDDFSAAYWPMLYNWYARGGLDHAATYLREFDVSEFDPKAPPPRTEAWHAIVNSNAAPEDAELADVLDSLGNPEAVTQPQVVAKATGDVYEWLTERKNRRVVPHRFEACGYVMLRNPDAADGSCSLCIPAHSTQIGCRALQGWHG